MDQATFDRIARLLGGGMNRRSGLRLALGALGFAAAAPDAGISASAKARDGRGHGAELKKKPKPEGPCGDGSGKDNHCTKDSDCCTGYCKKAKAKAGAQGKKGKKGGAGRCRCIKRGKPCADGQTCCGGAACVDGVCRHHQSTGTWVAKTTFGASQPAPGTNADDFNYPIDAALTADGLEMYVADDQNFRVAVWKRASVTAAWQVQTALGSGPGTANDQFGGPIGVALSADGLTLYVGDSPNDRIAVWTRASTAAAWAAQTPIASGQLNGPSRLASSPDNLTLYIVNADSHEIAVWARASLVAAWQAQALVGSGPGTANNQLTYPGGVAVTADGLEMYIGDAANNRVAVWTRATTAAPWAAQTPLGNGLGSANNQFSGPNKVVLADDGLTMFVADTTNNRIAVWTRATTAAAWAAQAPIASGPGTAVNQLDNPIGMGLSADFTWMAVADNNNNRIAVWHYE